MRWRPVGLKPIEQRWDINYASPLVRQPLFVCALSEDTQLGKAVQARGLAYNGPLTVVPNLGAVSPQRVLGNGVGRNQIRQSSFWGFVGSNAPVGDLQIPAQAADVIPAQGLTYAFIRQPFNTTITRSHNFGHNASAGTGRRAGGHVPFSDGTVYWDYGGATGNNRLTWTGYTPAVNMESWVFVGGLKGTAIYFNGLQRAVNTNAVTRTQGADTIGMNSGNQGTAGETMNIFFFAAFGAEWTESEVWQWNADPYSILKTRQRLLRIGPPTTHLPPGKPPKPPKPPPGKGPKDKNALELIGLTSLLQTAAFPPISYRPKFPLFTLPPVHLPPPKRATTLRQLMGTAASPKVQKKFILGEVPPSASSGEEIHGPGWKLFGHHLDGYHPPFKRERKVETLERDILRAYNRANGIEDEGEQREAVREIKATAATALSVGKKADDQRLVQLAQSIIALRALKLQNDAYLERVGIILAQKQASEADDMEALMFMAQFV